jgi:transposase-like protein
LSEYQEEAIAALLSQRNVEEAARAIGINPNTLLRWLKLPEFQTAYREARRLAFGQAIAPLQQATSAAATTLLKTMVDPASLLLDRSLMAITRIFQPQDRR